MSNYPNILYKYTKKEYLQNFFSKGEVRIGTLYDFQDIESHKAGLGEIDFKLKGFEEISI